MNAESKVASADGTVHPNMMSSGITLREYFAAMAMQGMLTNTLIPELMKAQKIHPDQVPEWIAIGAVEHADALLDELAKEPK